MVLTTTTCTSFPRLLSLYPNSLLRRGGGGIRKFHLYPRSGIVGCRMMDSAEKGLSAPLLDSVTQEFKNQSLVHQKKHNKLEDLNWDNSFVRDLPSDPRTDPLPREVLHACYTKVSPSVAVDDPQLVVWSESVADLLDLDNNEFQRPDFPLFFSGASPLVGALPYAQCYGGHQFGMWAGQLGDGRAITLGEILNSNSQRWELQLKGAGKTPYSRFADGLAVLRSSIREFLCSEAMHHLGIPTTRALSLVTTGKLVTRDMFYEYGCYFLLNCLVSPSGSSRPPVFVISVEAIQLPTWVDWE